ncbi:MAG: AMIN domain-containing protein [Desulfomonilaceae bacterium]
MISKLILPGKPFEERGQRYITGSRVGNLMAGLWKSKITVREVAIAAWLCAVVIVSMLWPGLGAADQGEISSVQVAPDLSSISIYSQGSLGKHTAFVIDRPYRLVIDFDSATIGNTKTRIRVERPPINEIRLGYHQNRARVVIDFGENPAPPYRIERNGDVVIVSLGKAPALPPSQARPKPESTPKKPSPKPPERAAAHQDVVKPAPEPPPPAVEPPPSAVAPAAPPEAAQNGDSGIVVKHAGIKSNLVYVELVDKNDPRISYRLIVDLDLEGLKMRSASLSDAKGNIRKFHVTRTETEKINSIAPGNRFTSGPKRYWPSSLRAAAPNISEADIETGPEKSHKGASTSPQSGWPLKIEAFQPQPKNAVR